jgi:squalene-associated FAD-dependent desaturase
VAKVAVIGAGWAGCSAALELAINGCQITLMEAARHLGGRARGVEIHGTLLDNGQHILLGAYSATLRAMTLAGVDADAALLNLPLQMRYPPKGIALGSGMDFVAPRWPAPWHLAAALLRATGLERADKMALARFSSTARWMGWQLHNDCSVSELLARFDQTERLVQLMWRPLCLAALNTPPERASAKVFLNVLRDSLGATRRASDMLLPRLDLGSLFPKAAADVVRAKGGNVQLGCKIDALAPLRQQFDAIVLATPATVAASLLRTLPEPAPNDLPVLAQLDAFTYEPITTCYLHYGPACKLDLPFYALVDDPACGHWGQFVFDRGQLDPAQAGWLAVVISASSDAAALEQAQLAQAIAAQLAQVFGRPELGNPGRSQVITEKRATFACPPNLSRPTNDSGYPGLVLAGDYTNSDYPATLEAAVRSGASAAKAVLAGLKH